MDSYKIEFKSTVEKDFSRLSKVIVDKAIERIESLARNPFPADVKKIRDSKRLFRIRVGDYRIVYEIDSTNRRIVIHYVRHRNEVYRNL